MSFARQGRPAHAALSEIGQSRDKPLPMAKTLTAGLIKAGFSDDDGNVENECFHWGSGKRLLQTQTKGCLMSTQVLESQSYSECQRPPAKQEA